MASEAAAPAAGETQLEVEGAVGRLPFSSDTGAGLLVSSKPFPQEGVFKTLPSRECLQNPYPFSSGTGAGLLVVQCNCARHQKEARALSAVRARAEVSFLVG